MIVGYTRTANGAHDNVTQTQALIDAGAERVFAEKMTEAGAHRPELAAMLSVCRRGDVIVVLSYDRLANSLTDLLEIIDQFQTLGVEMRVLEEDIDTTRPNGKMLLNLFAGLARFERKRIARRRREGHAIARKRGTRIGRPPVLSPAQKAIVRQMRDVEHWPVPKIAEIFNVSPRTIRRVD